MTKGQIEGGKGSGKNADREFTDKHVFESIYMNQLTRKAFDGREATSGIGLCC
jgi:hypothetical protein